MKFKIIRFADWLLKEENGGIESFWKANPKNPNDRNSDFLVLFGNTKPVKDKLKELGFRYFNGTWSIPRNLLNDSRKAALAELDIDADPLHKADTPATTTPTEPAEPKSAADKLLNNISNSLEKTINSSGSNIEGNNLITKIEKMIEDIAKSTDEAAKQEFIINFLKFSSKFYNYSLTNQILIWTQTRGKAEHVASATKWVELGRNVIDWKKRILIFAPNFKNVERENAKGEKEKIQLKYFKMVPVYDISATQPMPGSKNVFNPLSRKQWSEDSNEDIEEINVLINSLVKFIKEKNISINYEKLSEEMGGYSSGGKIVINNTYKGINLFSTLVHETAHELLHWINQSIARDKRYTEKETKKLYEIDAEATAYVVCYHFGFETKDSKNYLALHGLKGDDIRARALEKNIQKASSMMINGIKEKVVETEIEFENEDL